MDTVKIPKHIVERDLSDQKILLNLDDGEYYSLNETGALIWSQLKAGATKDNIASNMVTEFGITKETALNDLKDLVNELGQAGLLKGKL